MRICAEDDGEGGSGAMKLMVYYDVGVIGVSRDITQHT